MTYRSLILIAIVGTLSIAAVTSLITEPQPVITLETSLGQEVETSRL